MVALFQRCNRLRYFDVMSQQRIVSGGRIAYTTVKIMFRRELRILFQGIWPSGEALAFFVRSPKYKIPVAVD